MKGYHAERAESPCVLARIVLKNFTACLLVRDDMRSRLEDMLAELPIRMAWFLVGGGLFYIGTLVIFDELFRLDPKSRYHTMGQSVYFDDTLFWASLGIGFAMACAGPAIFRQYAHRGRGELARMRAVSRYRGPKEADEE
jgi:hypothetical protein